MTLAPYDGSSLVVGTSGGGKSTVAAGLIERLRAKGYAFCVIDPEGDYDGSKARWCWAARSVRRRWTNACSC